MSNHIVYTVGARFLSNVYTANLLKPQIPMDTLRQLQSAPAGLCCQRSTCPPLPQFRLSVLLTASASPFVSVGLCWAAWLSVSADIPLLATAPPLENLVLRASLHFASRNIRSTLPQSVSCYGARRTRVDQIPWMRCTKQTLEEPENFSNTTLQFVLATGVRPEC